MRKQPTSAAAPAAPRRRPMALAALIMAALLAASVSAQQYQTAQEVTDAMAELNAPATSVATMTLTITAASGHALTREMQLWSANEGKSQLIKFLSPADIRGSGFL